MNKTKSLRFGEYYEVYIVTWMMASFVAFLYFFTKAMYLFYGG